MNEATAVASPFNSSLETGVRSLVILVASYPLSLDLQRLVDFDYLVVHSGDANGPESLHPPLPMREGELLVRRKIIESGLSLMMSRKLIDRATSSTGISYEANELSKPFVDSLSTPYSRSLIERADWVANTFAGTTADELHSLINSFFDKWTTQFQSPHGFSG